MAVVGFLVHQEQDSRRQFLPVLLFSEPEVLEHFRVFSAANDFRVDPISHGPS